jgi:predicted aldo/keto reductase-like oxidoreductase
MMYLFQNGGLVTEKQTVASICVECGECLEKCPQHLPIPDMLKDVAEDMEGFMTKPLIWLGKRILKVRKIRK